MEEVITFALLGLGLGALYSLASQGLMVIYRGSGVVNFAQGAIGVTGAFVAWDLNVNAGLPYGLALILGVALSVAIGAVVHLAIMRPLRRAAPLARVVATLGVLIILQSLVILHYGTSVINVGPVLPTGAWHIFGDVIVSDDRLILLGIAAVLTAILWLGYRYTRFGIATYATSENEIAAGALGLSSSNIALANWCLGSGLAGLAAILVAPIIQLQASNMTTIVLASMAAALVANFRSFPIAFFAAMALGIAQTEVQRYVTVPGLAQSLPFLVIALILMISGRSLPLRDYFLQRLPAVGTGRVNVRWLLISVAVIVFLIAIASSTWQQAFIVSFATALVLLSIVVVTGFTGQISLAQLVIAGFGAYVCGRLVGTQGWPFIPAVIAGVLGAAAAGALFALPALRTRGINFAIVTLGLGTAVELMVFNNGSLTGGFSGTRVSPPNLLGMSFDPILHPARYAFLALGTFVFAGLVVASVRRGRVGRRMIAVRTNERAAAALGIDVAQTKLYAFALAGGVAALGGILLAFQSATILYTQFTSFGSITSMLFAVIGGVGSALGAIVGAAALAPGSLGAQLGDAIFGGIGEYIPLIGGVVAVLLVLQNQDGIVFENVRIIEAVRGKLSRPKRHKPFELPAGSRARVEPKTLVVDGLDVRFGGVQALNSVSLQLEPGKVVGLIGANGAGKTTFIDAVTGFVRPAAGSVVLDGVDLSRSSVAARAHAGIGRSFQALELFEDMTVLDNLRVAADPQDRISYLRDLVYPVAPEFSGEVVAAIREFGLEKSLDKRVEDLPYGERRLLGIARAIAIRPSVLLLDEPAAGLRGPESAELAAMVRRLADDWGMSILLVEHDMDFVMGICDRLVVLDFGQTIAEGPPKEVRTAPQVIAAYLGSAAEPEPAKPVEGETA
jgi:ABC-type branched-subunit amino acid transport system ATPase component/branched-subunit amino acid ABC-type transport system permease component